MSIRIEKLEIKEKFANIYLTDQKLPLRVSTTFVIDNRLVENIILTESQIDLIESEADLLKCDQRALKILTGRAHSIGELKQKLLRKDFQKDNIDTVLKKYKRLGYLDDNQYAYRLAEKIIESKPSGKAYVLSYLQRKLIPRHIAEQTADMLFSKLDLNQLAEKALERKMNQFEQLELEDARQKAYNYLSRRGFSYEASKNAFEKLLKTNSED